MSKQNSAAEIYVSENISGLSQNEQIELGLRQIAKIRINLGLIQSEITERLINEIKNCEQHIDDIMNAVGEINAIVKPKGSAEQ